MRRATMLVFVLALVVPAARLAVGISARVATPPTAIPAATEDAARAPAPRAASPTVEPASGVAARDALEEREPRAAWTIRVVAADDGLPVPGAQVAVVEDHDSWWKCCVDAWTLADASGAAVVERADAAVGTTAYAPGFARAVVAGLPSTIRLRRTRTLGGTVIDAVTGAPVEGATVTAYDDDDVGATGHPDPLRGAWPWDESSTDDDGGFRLGAGDAGLVEVIVGQRGYERAELVVDPSDAAPLLVRLRPTGVIRGVVRDPDGAPVAFANVHSRPEDGGADPEADDDFHGEPADEGGAYAIEGVSLGRPYRIWTDGEWCADTRLAPAVPATVVIPAEAREIVLDLTLRRPADLDIRVADDAGAPVPAARIALTLAADDFANVRDADEHGEAAFRTLPAGHVAVAVSADGHEAATFEADLVEGRCVQRTAVLRRGARVAGRVLDDRGAPVGGAEVRWYLAGSERGARCEGLVTTTADGAFAFLRNDASPVRIAATARGHVDAASAPTAPPQTGVVLACARTATVIGRLPRDTAPTSGGRCVALSWEWRTGAGDVLAAGSDWPEEDEGWRVSIDLPPGEGVLRIADARFRPVERSLRAESGATIDFGELRFEEGRTLTGRVTDAAGNGVAHAEVCVASDGDAPRESRTDALGRFVVAGLPPGALTISVAAEAFLARTAAIDASAASADLMLAEAAEVRVRVRSGDGCDPEGRHVTARRDGDPAPVETTTGSNGVARLFVAPGRWSVECGGVAAVVDAVPGTPVRVVLDFPGPPELDK